LVIQKNKQTNFTKDQNHFLWIFRTEKSSKILSNLIWSPTALHTGNMNIQFSCVCQILHLLSVQDLLATATGTGF